ncbi:MAG: hypothetical protein WD044_10195 [Dongiaceae bacterium]
MISRTLRMVLLLLSVGTAACEAPPSRGTFPELTYHHLATYRLDVAAIEIEEVYQSSRTDPNVEHLYPVTPATAARSWAEDRLEAVGIDGMARFIILDASAVERRRVAPPAGSGSTDPLDRYDMRIAVRIELVKAGGGDQAFVTADVTLQQYVEPSTSMNDRERIWFDNVETLMRSLNAELEPRIAATFGPYLR